MAIRTDFTNWKCEQCDFEIHNENNEQAYDEMLNHIFTGHVNLEKPIFRLNKIEAAQLQKFIYDNGYISREFHDGVHEIVRKLDKFLESE